MTTTLQSLIIIWLAILPGALFIWAFEQLAGRWATGIRNSFWRSIGYSAVFHVFFLPLTYYLWFSYKDPFIAGNFVSLWAWILVFPYVILPVVMGLLVGWIILNEESISNKWYYWWIKWIKGLIGRSPAPRAWDFLFSGHPSGWVHLRMKSGESQVGLYGQGSYAAGYPEPQDIYLSHTFAFNTGSGKFEETDESRGLLVRWDEIEYLEFIPSERRDMYG